jgi:large subunit ribosomal protein L32
MPVPKQRLGSSDQGHRRSRWKAFKPETAQCKNCGQPHLAHNACLACGFYNGKFVSEKLLKRKAAFSN